MTSILDCFMYARWIFWTGRLKSDLHVAVSFVWTWAGSWRICYGCRAHYQFVASRIWNIEYLKYIWQGKTSTLCIDQTAYNLLNCCLLVNQTCVKWMKLWHYCSNFLAWHLAMFTVMKGFYNLITTTFLKFSKSITFAQALHV